MAARQNDDDRIIMLSSPERESENHASSRVNDEAISSISKQFISSIVKYVEKKELLDILLRIWCILAISLDPLFCYILLVDRNKNCIGFDKTLRLVALVLRSLMDFGYILLVVFQFLNLNSLYAQYVDGGIWPTAKKYLLSSFKIDILAVFPFPQVLLFVLFRSTNDSHFPLTLRVLATVLPAQLFPRVYRMYSFLKKVRWDTGIISDSTRAKAMFNFFLYLLASHSFGAFWYLSSIERKATCLQQQCHSHPYCPRSNNNSTIEICINNCSGTASSNNTAAFTFGIFGDALNSGIVYSTDFYKKLCYCFYWGLQNLSSFGQGLKPSEDIREIFFSIFLTVSGLILFAILIGNFQAILQARVARQEDTRLEKEETEEETEKETRDESTRALPENVMEKTIVKKEEKEMQGSAGPSNNV